MSHETTSNIVLVILYSAFHVIGLEYMIRFLPYLPNTRYDLDILAFVMITYFMTDIFLQGKKLNTRA